MKKATLKVLAITGFAIVLCGGGAHGQSMRGGSNNGGLHSIPEGTWASASSARIEGAGHGFAGSGSGSHGFAAGGTESHGFAAGGKEGHGLAAKGREGHGLVARGGEGHGRAAGTGTHG